MKVKSQLDYDLLSRQNVEVRQRLRNLRNVIKFVATNIDSEPILMAAHIKEVSKSLDEANFICIMEGK